MLASSCAPGLPGDGGDDSAPSTDDGGGVDSDVPDVDSDEPPCDAPEVEPNDAPEARQLLPLEAQGCGSFQTELDGDGWSFDVPEPAWIDVDVRAARLGSSADVQLLLASDDGAVRAFSSHLDDSSDAWARFEAPAGRYHVLVRQAVGADGAVLPPGAGPDYFYAWRPSVTKPPGAWDVESDAGAPLDVPVGGSRVGFGRLPEDDSRATWTVAVPAGAHRLTLDVRARALGAVGDLSLRASVAGVQVGAAERGRTRDESDPFLSIPVDGPAEVAVAVYDAARTGGAAHWYLLTASLEAR
jgi:hypothetical protein